MDEDKYYFVMEALKVTEMTKDCMHNIQKLLDMRACYAKFANDSGLSDENKALAVRCVDMCNRDIKLLLGL